MDARYSKNPIIRNPKHQKKQFGIEKMLIFVGMKPAIFLVICNHFETHKIFSGIIWLMINHVPIYFTFPTKKINIP